MAPRRPTNLAPQFSLRTLLFLMLIAGPLCGWGWLRWQAWRDWQVEQEARHLREQAWATELAQMRSLYTRNMQALQSAQGALNGETTKVSDETSAEYEHLGSDESFPESDPRGR